MLDMTDSSHCYLVKGVFIKFNIANFWQMNHRAACEHRRGGPARVKPERLTASPPGRPLGFPGR